MTRMPLVQRKVAAFFGIEPCKGVHPEEVVALGAAIQAGALIDNTPELLLLDVTPHSLGIMIVGGYFHRLIEQNTTIPTRAGHVFTTVRDNQTSVKILVLQGESDKAAENEMLGEFILSGLRRAPRGQVEVEVTFSISVDGIVSVSAKDLETGREQSITVTATSGLTEDELKDLVKQSQSYMIELRASEEIERRRQQAEKLIDTIRGLFPQVQEAMSGTRFGRDAIAKAEAVVQRAEEDLARGDARTLLDTMQSLDRTLGMFKNVMHKKSEAAHR
jgi:molecular chaperone DnaK